LCEQLKRESALKDRSKVKALPIENQDTRYLEDCVQNSIQILQVPSNAIWVDKCPNGVQGHDESSF